MAVILNYFAVYCIANLMWTSHIQDLKIFSCKLKFVPIGQENHD